jgi:UDP-2,3-diacylglucosamine hydrolase
MQTDEGRIYFFSDAHLSARRTLLEIEKARRLDSFLAHVRDRGSALYVLGDLFDFWFEYRHAIPSGHLWLFRRLAEIRDRAIPMTFIPGNHDYWCIPFLRREFGFTTSDAPIALTLQGRRAWLAHGDGLIRRDRAYRALRKVLRSRLCIGAFRLIHPDLAAPFALLTSDTSAAYTETRCPEPDEYLVEVVRPKFAEGFDAVVMGHVHIPTHVQEGGKDFLFLGDWIRHFSYVTLEGGVFSLHNWTAAGPAEG